MFNPKSLLGKLFRYYLLLPSHPSKIRIQNYLGNLWFPNGITIQNSDGLHFILSANDWITRHMITKGSYESESIFLAKKILAKGGVFIDVGANFGLYSCTLTHNKNVMAIAIDPNYKILSRLLLNIRSNKLINKIKIINAAVSREFQLVSLEEPNASNLGTTVANPNGSGILSVLSCPLQYILQVHNINNIDLVKIDIEGNEFDILENFPFQTYNIGNIILEFRRDSKITLQALRNFFSALSFKILNVKGEEIIDEEGIIEDNIWLKNSAFTKPD